MKQGKLSHVSTSANCNPKSHTLKQLNVNTLAFSFSSQIGLYNISKNRIIMNINDRSKNHNRVNCLHCLHLGEEEYIICGYDSGWLACYRLFKNYDGWELVFSEKQDGGMIFVQAVWEENSQMYHVVTANHMGAVNTYAFAKKKKLELIQQIQFPLMRIIQACSITVINNHLIMFLAGVDQKIHYYEKPLSSTNFTYKFSLSGHQNSITKLTLTSMSPTQTNPDYLLASSSKDGYIRLWKITQKKSLSKYHKNVEKLMVDHDIYLDAVLASHECSVTSLCWVSFSGRLQLVSCSMDCTVCIWGSNEDGAWSVDSRLGQFLGNKNAYFDVIAGENSIIALNYVGSVLIWEHSNGDYSLRECFNGHSKEVTSLQWNHNGKFLVSVSKDQTTRIQAENTLTKTYHEISRAQIHGYDINSLELIPPKQNTIDVIICGAQQKVIRVIEPPACFANFLNSFSQQNLHLYFDNDEEEKKYVVSKQTDKVLLYEAYAEGGTQVLGLMTKMQKVEREKVVDYYEEDDEGGPVIGENPQKEETSIREDKVDYRKPPHQDYLIKHTLWPQINKLYGHPHEIQSLCKSHKSKKLASSCTALNKTAASIIIWSTENWQLEKIITHHSYTVLGMEFTPNDKHLISVSKDRKVAVFSTDNYELEYSYEAHSRTIQTVSIHKSGKTFITGSRDKFIKLHSLQEKKVVGELDVGAVVTALEFCKVEGFEDVFACGFLDGSVFVGKISVNSIELISQVPDLYGHTKSVNKLRWNGRLLASCSDDFSVKVFELCQ